MFESSIQRLDVARSHHSKHPQDDKTVCCCSDAAKNVPTTDQDQETESPTSPTYNTQEMNEGKHDHPNQSFDETEKSYVSKSKAALTDLVGESKGSSIQGMKDNRSHHSKHPQEGKHDQSPVAFRTRSRKSDPPADYIYPASSNLPTSPTRAYAFRRRATQRWCKLLTATKSRLAQNGLKEALGPHWKDFVQYAACHFRPHWLETFSLPMECNGPLTGRHCPFNLRVDTQCPEDIDLMHLLHLDHAYPVHIICRTWLRIIRSQHTPMTSWDQGVDKDLVCQLLFGIKDHPKFSETGHLLWKANLQFRCYHRDGQGCHDVCGHANAHLRLLTTDLLRKKS